ncbi:macro domain-containing protein [Owenweeksia hongkongensis]|uniref:macro domain-containing protein n=1 Tax=Owenweeksia hongkongensis TaxID=253245 RepID=UPI003A8FA6AD
MIKIILGDITHSPADVIVNAANSALRGGGGVDGAIHRAAGPIIVEECKAWVKENGELPTGRAMFTSAGKLSHKGIIHTVGPVWEGGIANEDQLLAECYINALHIAFEKGFDSIAFPNISTGVYGFPKKDAADVAICTVQNFLGSRKEHLKVTFVCFDQENFDIYKSFLDED